ncbi:MAG: hypothetical protein ACI9FJ_001045 [Alteromonadaceae bacterium]|jgi:hypothetical protein
MRHFNLPISAIAAGIVLAYAAQSMAAPWVDTQDPYLKASITALSNGGVLKAPVNTYPLMWKSISGDLNAANASLVPEYLKYAIKHVKHALKHSQKARSSGLKIKVASKNNDFQSFGEQYYAKSELNLFNEYIGDSWAVKTSFHIVGNANNNKNIGYQGSYAAYMLGNWVASVDQVSQWWGPGNDSVLALSNNAIAFPAVRLTRHMAEPIDLPALNLLGPLSFTTYFGQQEHSNSLQSIRLWGARVNFKPMPSLEIGLTRVAQWSGEGRPGGFSTFIKLLAGKDNAGESSGSDVTLAEEPGNQLGGIDFRFNTSLFNQPLAFYGEVIGEDESHGLPSRSMRQWGFETSFGGRDEIYHAYAEYTDTYVEDCTQGSGVGNCAYEHHIYQDGYRRYGRSMGSTYDSDARVFTLGLSHTQAGGHSWYSKLKYMQLNADNSNLKWTLGQLVINPVSQYAQDRFQIEGGYTFPVQGGLLNVEASLYHSEIDQTGETDTDGILQASWEYRF